MSLRRSLHGARSVDEVGFLCIAIALSLRSACRLKLLGREGPEVGLHSLMIDPA